MKKVKPVSCFALIVFFSGSLPAANQDAVQRIVSRPPHKGTLNFISDPGQARISFKAPGPYRALISKYAIKHNMREDLVIAVIKAESNFNPGAVSPKGAAGLMQLMPATATFYGVKDRFNVNQNLDAGIKHLKYLYDKFKQNIPLTLAAYNAGEEAVRKYGGIPPFRETREYIRRIQRFLGQAADGGSGRARIYKYVNEQGRILITDTPPSGQNVNFEILE